MLTAFRSWLRLAGAFTQDLATLGQEEPLKVTGSFNATGIGYTPFRISPRREPFFWFTNGSVNVSLYGWSVSFSFSLSD